jgi:hypothetical protein
MGSTKPLCIRQTLSNFWLFHVLPNLNERLVFVPQYRNVDMAMKQHSLSAFDYENIEILV